MLEIVIPSRGLLQPAHLVLDVNGTIIGNGANDVIMFVQFV